ncbi:hypothetical protein BFW38_12965 [Terasakiispira papahanaumokuakeensis]|uniref:tRNA (guanosine(18)-2'-O)-methyltransferase n=1 Tax=Terasakiispira papahanaumokuakeensis TaxID=197479 RepID=A0A1E2VBB9_9GAMM|nr:tRNA (guanosine(18)-2'-O)-methyltransferase TrmH [Terasakiispira papahanaumokuakeensis]ODC04308.1 hypothetical protein BFW38_12965 [Terasakiispira papahanaumokuakeensis]
MTFARVQRLKDVLARRQPDLTVLTDFVNKPHNIAAIQRTCDAVGVHELHIALDQGAFRQARMTSGGTYRWVPVIQHFSSVDAASHLRGQGFKLVAAQWSERAIAYDHYDFTQPTALIMGAEKQGVSPELTEMADEHLMIPMQGMAASFNVSVAAAIMLNEARLQRERAGCYQRSHLDPETFEKTLFRWLQPNIADLCERLNEPYPELDDEGDLINPSAWFARISPMAQAAGLPLRHIMHKS